MTHLHPLNQSEVFGHTMFDETERGACARKTMESGEYTIAGPFKLIQSGTGALLLDPIYTTDASGCKQFWGFSLLVIDWEKFVDELQLNKLEEASYHFRIWKKAAVTGKRVCIAQCDTSDVKDALEVTCEVPNDQWYFEFEPEDSWYSAGQIAADIVFSTVFALLLAVVYWQFTVRRCKDRAYAEEIKRSADAERAANYLLALINDVLQMSKLESGEVVPARKVVNLNELSNDIQTLVGQRAEESGVSLYYDRLSDKRVYPYVYGSSLHLRQIFLNIYGNAIKYNHVGGSVKTHLSCFGAENGTITVKSAPNEGSTFVIKLPFEIADAQQPAVRETGEKDSICGLHLLLIEDNELNAEIAETLLRDKSAEITVVSDGTQAIEKFTDSPAGTYDAIIMDIMKPEVDGLAATRAIRAMKRPDAWRIPIIAMTANAFDEDMRRCLAAGHECTSGKAAADRQRRADDCRALQQVKCTALRKFPRCCILHL